MSDPGVVYIVRNPLEPLNYYKVGRSNNSASERIRTGQTWISEDIEIIKEFNVTNAVLSERAAHRALQPYNIRSEIFECDIDILIGKVKESIVPWLNKTNNIDTSSWLIDFFKEYSFCENPNCGLCRATTEEFINELLMRSLTNPLGLNREERVIHQESTSQLIKNAKIGTIILDALKNINLADLMDIGHSGRWQSVLNCLFALDAKTGFLEFNNDYPALPNTFEAQQYWQRISQHGD